MSKEVVETKNEVAEPEKNIVITVPVVDVKETDPTDFDKKLVINSSDALLYQSVDGEWQKIGPYTGKFVKNVNTTEITEK